MSSSLCKIKIGVVSLQGAGQSATDRFRYDPLVRGLSKLGYNIHYYDSTEANYDIIVMPLKKKPNLLLQLKQKAGLIIGDVTDDMLSYPPHTWYNRLGKIYQVFAARYQRQYYLRLLKQCDWVVVGSAGQADSFQNYTKGVSVITDAILEADSQHTATYQTRQPCRLVWFGHVQSLAGLAAVQPALDKLAQTGYYALHLITSATPWPRVWGHWSHNVYRLMARQQMPCQFHPWSSLTYAPIIVESDIALMPVDLEADFNLRKPAGRVLLAMALGLPVVAAAIPAYEAVVESTRTGYIARNLDDWVMAIEQLAHNMSRRQTLGQAARYFALTHYNEQRFVQQYAAVLSRVTA